MTGPETEAPPERSSPWLLRALDGHAAPLLALLALGLLAYADAFHGAFVYDDVRHVRDNPLIRDLGNFLAGTRAFREQPHRVLGYLSFALNYRLGGLDTFGYHAVNVAVHLANAALVYALVALALRAPRLRGSALAGSERAVAFLAAALFVAHPLQTQAVTYVVQRFTSLAALFYLLAAVLFARWRQGGLAPGAAAACYGGALAAALAAMHTKEIAVTLPLAIAWYELSFHEAPWRRRLRFLAPVFATGLVVPLAQLWHAGVMRDPGKLDQAARLQTSLGRLDYLRTEIPVVVTYLRLLVWPQGQSLDHDFPIQHRFLAAPVAGGLALLLALVALALALHRRTARRGAGPDPGLRLVSFGIGWFFLALLVESSVVPIADVIYEHRVYLPSAGFFAALAALLGLAARRFAPERPRRVTWLAGAGLGLVLALATLARNQVWADEVALWSNAAASSTRLRPHLNLGTALAATGRLGEAAAELGRAVELAPDSAYARAQLGTVLLVLGRPADAEPQLREAVRLAPKDPDPLFNLALMLARTGRAEEARPLFARFLEVAPASYGGARRLAAAQVARAEAGPRAQ